MKASDSSNAATSGCGESKQSKGVGGCGNASKYASKFGGKQFSSSKTESYAIMFPNALPVKQVVWAKDSVLNAWKYASIIHARRRTDKDVDVPATGPEFYDYYIHWEGMDRRLDCWIEWSSMKGLEEKLPEGEYVMNMTNRSHVHFFNFNNNNTNENLTNKQHHLSAIIHTTHDDDDDHAGMDEEYLREHEENTKLKTIKKIRMGRHTVDTWYFSPYPKEYQNIDLLHLCEFCLSFFKEDCEIHKHRTRCEIRFPPGNEIYRDENIAMFEIDGTHSRVYCENLCYLSKLFLDHKTLRHPVNLFLFYVMTEVDEIGYHITGYFSKEKYSKNNVSCILILPQHQRKGYGKFLINFSYALSRVEKKTGTPERPLSDLGKSSYMSYWTEKLLHIIHNHKGNISIQDLSNMTCIETADIINCLEEIGILKSAQSGEYFLFLTDDLNIELHRRAGHVTRPVIMKQLHWIPYDRFMATYEYNPQA